MTSTVIVRHAVSSSCRNWLVVRRAHRHSGLAGKLHSTAGRIVAKQRPGIAAEGNPNTLCLTHRASSSRVNSTKMTDNLFQHAFLLVLIAPFVGSFLGLLVVRLPRGSAVIAGRSVCDRCGRILSLRDLVPLLSWCCSLGRCRICSGKIDLAHPAMELGAVVVVLWAATEQSGSILWLSCFLGWCLLTLAFVDFRAFILPDCLTLPLLAVGLLMVALFVPERLVDHVVGAAMGYSIFVLLRWLYAQLRSREGLGLGDAKLLAASGAWLAWWSLASVVLVAAVMALASHSIQSLLVGRIKATDKIPFGGYLCFGTWLVWLYGPLVLP